MNKDDAILYLVIGILAMFLIGNMIQVALSRQEETIESVVIDSKCINEYIEVTFDNGETYNIAFPYEYADFTVNSKLIIKLRKNDWWLWPNVNDVWMITGYIKVPNNLDT